MKKYSVILFAGLLGACSVAQVDHTRTAECSYDSGRIIQAPTVQRNSGEHFLRQHQQNKEADRARAHARQTGCLQ